MGNDLHKFLFKISDRHGHLVSTSSLVRWTIQLQVPSTRRASMPVTFWNNPLQPELRKDKPTRTWKSRYQNMMFNPAANHWSKMKKNNDDRAHIVPYFAWGCEDMKSMARLMELILSASLSGISNWNSSSRAITISTLSRLSNPRSLWKWAFGVTYKSEK